ncbi:hypothetical protein [Halococcus thailandensis]|uniref:hypothetical protein n=1 Tax=Halococcus thailandensis TaxID=335952 RepID=UPI0012690695|nr:hypothetical protein [Halococcus thailandensis]
MPKDDFRTILNEIRGNLPILLAYGFVILLIIWAVLEWLGITNWIAYSLPLSSPNFAQIASGIGSVILSFGLLLLYDRQTQIQRRQTNIQENQESLMEQQFTPYITGEVAPFNIASAQFQIRNTGNGPAYDVEAKWDIGNETRIWRIPSLPPGEDYGFPVVVDGGNWLLGIGEIQEYLEEHDASSVIDYTITCETRFGEKQTFEKSVDFSSLIARSESDEIWSNSPLEEISNDMSKIQRDVRKMRRYERNSDRASDWQHRIQQTETIRKLVCEHEELTVNQLAELTNIRERDIDNHLQSLDASGALCYDGDNSIATIDRGLQPDTTLSEF